MFADELGLLNEFEREGDDGLFSSHRHQLVNAPLLKLAALQHRLDDFPSRGLLGVSDGERIYINTNAPNSGVVCGVQGSGKSHTLSCILENALISSSRIGALPEPLAALVFHFDQQECGRPCEAAFLASPVVTLSGSVSVPRVTVLCSPSNLVRRTQAYSSLINVRVEPLFLSEQDLTVDRMLSLMGCDNLEAMPLYMNTVLRIMRSMGIDRFTYSEFKRQLAAERLQGKQKSMLKLRLDLLDSYLRPESPNIRSYFAVGEIVLVDLTDPFLDGTTAGLLFDIVLDSFVGWQAASGKIVVLDEAHNFLISSESSRLNQSLANTIRLQRHLATRVIIATQEPTVVPRTILDLSTFIVCHRFSSPSWCEHLSRHVNNVQSEAGDVWFKQVMLLATGESIVFSPTTLVSVNQDHEIELLGGRYLKVKVRPRLTRDGGRSLLTVGQAMEARSVAEAVTSITQPSQTVTSENSVSPLFSDVGGFPKLAESSTSSALPVPFSTPVTVSSATTSTIPPPVTINSRFDGLVAFLREQQARGIHQVTWSDVGENVRLRHAEDGTPLRVRVFLGEAAEKGIVSITGEPEEGTDWVSLPPATPIPTTVPPTTGSVSSPLLSPSLAPASNPAIVSPVPAIKFKALVAFLEQQRTIGVVRVPWSVAQAVVSDQQGPSGLQRPAPFLAEAIQEGVVVADACITPTWVALPPSTSCNSAAVVADSIGREPVTRAPSPTQSTSAAVTVAPSNREVIAADVPPRFRLLVNFLQKQHASGVPHVSFTSIGNRVKNRLSATGTQVKVKAFVENAQQLGVVICGRTGKEHWVALRNEQTSIETPVTTQASAMSVPAHRPGPITRSRSRLLAEQADQLATSSDSISQSTLSTAPTRTVETTFRDLQPLIEVLRQQARSGVAFVSMKKVVTALKENSDWADVGERAESIVQLAQESGIVTVASREPGGLCVALCEQIRPSSSTSKTESVSAQVMVSPAISSSSSSPLSTRGRFDALVAFLRDKPAKGRRRVTWSNVGKHIRKRLGADGSQLEMQAFLQEAAAAGIVRLSPEGERRTVTLEPALHTPVQPALSQTASPALDEYSTSAASAIDRRITAEVQEFLY